MKSKEKNKLFRVLIPLLVSQSIGAFNDNGIKAMLPIMAAYQFGKDKMDETNQIVSILLILPFVLFAPLAGWFSDRYAKKNVVSYALLAQVLGLGVLCISMILQSLSLSLLGFFMLAVQSAFFSPAKKGILKELVGSEKLGMAVGWMEMLTMVGILGGAFAAASYFDKLVTQVGGWQAGLVLSTVAILLAIFSWLLFLPTPRTNVQKAEPFQANVVWNYWTDLKFLWKDKKLRGAALGDAWFWSVGGFVYLVLVKLSGEVVDGKVGMGSLYGYWFLLLGLGIMIGSLFAAYLNRGRVEVGVTGIGAIFLPVSLFILFWANPLSKVFEYGTLFLGFSGALFFVPLNGFLQDRAGESMRGRILASSNLLTQLTGIGFVLFHALLSYLGFSAKEELLIMFLPAVLIAFACMKYLMEDFFRAWFHIFLRIFYRIKIIGMENFSSRGGVLIVSNHLSYGDPVFIGAAFPRKIRYLAFEGLANSSLMRIIFRLTETETISSERSLDSIKKSVRKLKDGIPLCVFAEGGISRTGSIFPFKRGILILAKQANVPILPVHIDRVWGSIFSMERGEFFKKVPLSFPYTLSVRVGEPIQANKVGIEEIQRQVLELGRLSFNSRLPEAKMAKKELFHTLDLKKGSEFLFLDDQPPLCRGDFVSCLKNNNEVGNISDFVGELIRKMNRTLRQKDGAKKIIASSSRLKETHLWDHPSFEVIFDNMIHPEWIIWAALLGNRRVKLTTESISIYKDKILCEKPLQSLNALSSEKNGLISMNYRSLAELSGEFDELEVSFKQDTHGRLFPGLSYVKEPKFGILGIDGEIEVLSNVSGFDGDGFLTEG